MMNKNEYFMEKLLAEKIKAERSLPIRNFDFDQQGKIQMIIENVNLNLDGKETVSVLEELKDQNLSNKKELEVFKKLLRKISCI
jgi:hypothetical protein